MNRTWLGVGFVVVLALALVFALSQGGDDPPATTSTTAAAAPTTVAPTTAPPTTTIPPTTTSGPTTTQDLSAREAEVEALVRDLEFALWDADYRRDIAGLEDVIGGQGLWERWMSVDDPLSYYATAPTADTFNLKLEAILLDREDCIVADVVEDPTGFLNEDAIVEELTIVMWSASEASLGWRLAERFGGTTEERWRALCDAPDRDWRP